MIKQRYTAFTTALAGVMLFAFAAEAGVGGTFPFIGKVGTGAGRFVNLPASGPSGCDDIVGRTNVNITGGTGSLNTKATMTPASLFTQPLNPLNPYGCIPGAQNGETTVMTDGAGGFMIPVGFFSIPFPGMLRVVPVPNTPMIVQLATSFKFTGPYNYTMAFEAVAPRKGGAPTFAPLANWNSFKANAYASHSGRVSADFTVCPAAAGPGVACDYASSGVFPALLKNIGGANKFGGTMGLVIESGTNVASLGLTLGGGTAGMLGTVVVVGMGSRAAGRGYAAYDTDFLGMGGIFSMFWLTTNTPNPSMAIIKSVGAMTGFLAGGMNNNYGFPWTTGTIIARGTGRTIFAMTTIQSITAQGTDKRSPGGSGTLQLVAGHLSQSTVQGANGTPNYSVMRLPEPKGATPLVAAVLALIGIGAWRARKH